MSLSADPKFQAALALHRFGLGPKPRSIAVIASDPRGALLAEVDRPGAGLVSDASLMTAAKSSMAAYMFRQERAAQRIAKRAEQASMTNAPAPMAAGDPKLTAAKPDAPKKPREPNVQQRIFRNEA